MPSKDSKILTFTQYYESTKAPALIYSDIECLIKKVDGIKHKPVKSSTTKVGEHNPCGFSMLMWFHVVVKCPYTFDGIENKGCVKRFCKSFKEHAMKIINFEKKKMLQLTNKDYINIFFLYIIISIF